MQGKGGKFTVFGISEVGKDIKLLCMIPSISPPPLLSPPPLPPSPPPLTLPPPTDGFVVLESVVHHGSHVGILPNGQAKPANQTGTGDHARFFPEVVGENPENIRAGDSVLQVRTDLLCEYFYDWLTRMQMIIIMICCPVCGLFL